MKKSELVVIMQRLSAAYGDRFPINADRTKLFWEYLKDYNPKEVWWGVTDYIAKSKYAPTVCDLLEAIEPYKGRARKEK